MTDELTGLYNRSGFFALGEQLIRTAERERQALYMLCAVLDSLKEINRTFGHEEGDKALVEVAAVLKENYRNSDIIARIGGDEFAVVPVGPSPESAESSTGRLLNTLEAHNSRMDRNFRLILNLGIGYCDPLQACSLEDLLGLAESSMHERIQKKPAETDPG